MASTKLHIVEMALTDEQYKLLLLTLQKKQQDLLVNRSCCEKQTSIDRFEKRAKLVDSLIKQVTS